jgi:transcriptional regulator with XRE-family HTH domain
LGAFLRSRRTLLAPDAVGLPALGPRRTSGLRREELARLAGLSAGYYVRLEQGRALDPSPGVLGALARALRLSAAEHAHLFALAGRLRTEPEPASAAPAARRMLGLLAPSTAAYVISRHSDVLLWNATAAALFGHLVDGPRRPNNVRYIFTDPTAKGMFVAWPEIAADSVAHLRAATGHHPDDADLAALVGELTDVSTEFRELWADRELRHKADGRKELCHPVAGRLSLDYAVLATPTASGQRLVAYGAAPGTASHDALERLRRSAPRVQPA